MKCIEFVYVYSVFIVIVFILTNAKLFYLLVLGISVIGKNIMVMEFKILSLKKKKNFYSKSHISFIEVII